MPRRAQRNIGLIGLGIIGSRVADNLRAKGFHVFVWNRNPRPVPNFVGAPVDVTEMCDHIQIFVSDDDALLDVMRQLAPALAPRHIVMAHPTVAPHSMLAAADIVERRGARFIEAPFTGSRAAAEKGELVYYVAGDEVALREARPTLEASSKEVVEIGQIGQATVIKIATNILTAAIVQAAAEGLALTHSSGVPLEKFSAALKSNASNSGTLSMKLPKMIEGDFEPHFSIKHMLKDMQIAHRVGLLNHLELSVTAATRDRLFEQMERGFGDEDFSALARKYLHEIRPADQEAANLELFQQPFEQPFAASEFAEPFGSALNTDFPSGQTEATPQETQPSELTDQPAGGEMQPKSEELTNESPTASESASEQESAEPVPETSAVSTATAEPERTAEGESASASHRGFFDRLLRRNGEG